MQELHKLGGIKYNEYLVSPDAKSMCPNIDTEEGIAAMLLSFDLNIVNFNTDSMPIKQLMRALRLLMKCNVFKFAKHAIFK